MAEPETARSSRSSVVLPGAPEIHSKVLESMVEGVTLTDEDGNILYTNAAQDWIFGYQPGELIGQNVRIQNAYPHQDDSRTIAEIIQQLKPAGAWKGELRNRRKNGTEFRTCARIASIEAEGRRYWLCVQEDITERTLVQERLRAFIDATSSVFWTADAKGRFVTRQESWERFTGQIWPDYRGTWGDAAIAPEHRDRIEAFWSDAPANPDVSQIEYRLWHADTATYRYVCARVVPVRGQDGAVREWVGTVTDVEAIRAADRDRRATSEKLRSLIQASPIPIVTLTRDGLIEVWNPAAEQAFGWTASEVLGKPLPFIPEEKLPEHREMRRRDLSGAGFTNREIRRRRKDGLPIDLLVSTAPIREADGTVQGIMAVYMDITERKRMESELRVSEQNFRLMTQAIPALVWTCLPDGYADFSNDSWLTYTGQTLEQSHGAGWMDVVHPDDHQRIRNLWPRALQTGTPFEITYRIRRVSDAQWRWHLVRALPARDSSGQIVKWLGTSTDIHEQVASAERLRESEQRFRTLFDQSPVPIWEEDWSGAKAYFGGAPVSELVRRVVVLDANRAAVDLFGSADKGPVFMRVPAGSGPQAATDVIDALARGETAYRCELVLETLARERRNVIYDLAVLPGHERRLNRVIVTLTDITERKRAEEALRRSEVYFRELADSAPAMLWLTNEHGDTVYLNRRWYEYTGTPVSGGGLGLGWVDTVHPDDQLRALKAFRDALDSRGTFTCDYRVRRIDGEWRWAVNTGEVRLGSAGEFLGYVGTIIDITERKCAEDELRARNEELRQANSELEEFAYVASHDLQEPLRTVNIYTELLLRRFPIESPDVHTFARFIHTGVARMEVLIQDLLAYSRNVHTLKQQEEPGEAELANVLEGAVRTLRDRIQAAGAEVNAGELPRVRADAAQIEQVFQNLIANAIKYCPCEVRPKVDVRAVRAGGEWVVSVTDNGIGFDQKYAERVFGLFKRLHRDEYPGTGLGLAICKRIVERYGGRIWAQSEPGKGSTFSFSIRAV